MTKTPFAEPPLSEQSSPYLIAIRLSPSSITVRLWFTMYFFRKLPGDIVSSGFSVAYGHCFNMTFAQYIVYRPWLKDREQVIWMGEEYDPAAIKTIYSCPVFFFAVSKKGAITPSIGPAMCSNISCIWWILFEIFSKSCAIGNAWRIHLNSVNRGFKSDCGNARNYPSPNHYLHPATDIAMNQRHMTD